MTRLDPADTAPMPILHPCHYSTRGNAHDVIVIYHRICITMMMVYAMHVRIVRHTTLVGILMTGDRTWTGTRDDMSVSDFIRRIGDDVISTHESAVVKNIAIKYYMEMAVNFNGQHKMDIFKIHQPGFSYRQQHQMWRTWTLTTC